MGGEGGRERGAETAYTVNVWVDLCFLTETRLPHIHYSAAWVLHLIVHHQLLSKSETTCGSRFLWPCLFRSWASPIAPGCPSNILGPRCIQDSSRTHLSGLIQNTVACVLCRDHLPLSFPFFHQILTQLPSAQSGLPLPLSAHPR